LYDSNVVRVAYENELEPDEEQVVYEIGRIADLAKIVDSVAAKRMTWMLSRERESKQKAGEGNRD